MSYTAGNGTRHVMEEQGVMSQYLHPHHNTPIKLEGLMSQPNGLWEFPVPCTSRVPISKFRGVVSLSDGNWDAQIKFNDKPVSLGVFKTENEAAMAYGMFQRKPKPDLKELFQKELTSLDVGSKHNRLVIPKQYATRHFGRVVKDVDMKFFDRENKPWVFRYGPIKRSYVFTEGWNRFVNEKRLNANDKIIFSTEKSFGTLVHIIDVSYSSRRSVGGVKIEDVEDDKTNVKRMKKNIIERVEDNVKMVEENIERVEGHRSGIKLFGKWIIVD